MVMKSNRPRSLDLSSWSVTSMASGASSQTSSSGSQVESGGGDDCKSGSHDHARLITNKTEAAVKLAPPLALLITH